MHVIGLLHDDIILRLCKLDEDDCRSWSFAQAFKKLRKRSPPAFDETIVEQNIYAFRVLVVPLRQHRDSRIAHRLKRDGGFLKPPILLPAIGLAVEIADALSGEKAQYEFLDLDLRADLHV